MRLDTGIRIVDVLLGSSSHSAGAISVIDWQRAPLAELFFTCDEGERYELDICDRVISGTLLEKTLVITRGDTVVFVEHGDAQSQLESGGEQVRR